MNIRKSIRVPSYTQMIIIRGDFNKGNISKVGVMSQENHKESVVSRTGNSWAPWNIPRLTVVSERIWK